MTNRLQYENWPRWVKIPYLCTFPVSCTVLMFLMMLGSMAFGGLLLMILISDWLGWRTG